MAYDINDLIEKAIGLEKKRQEVYENIGIINLGDKRIKTITTILNRLIQTDIEFLRSIMIKSENTDTNEINFYTYDKISSLINEFSMKFDQPIIHDPSNLLKLAYDIEEKTLALFIDIQGRLIVDGNSTKTRVYEVVQSIIDRRRKNIKNLDTFVDK